jgi:hypothetical protein
MALTVVLSDGEHHNATITTLDFLGSRDRIHSLRLHPHAETAEKATNFAGSDVGGTAARLFCFRRRIGW